MVEKHGIFQGYYFFGHVGLDANMREQFRGYLHCERTARFREIYDNPAFDSAMECEPLEFLGPRLRRVFATPRNSISGDPRHNQGGDRRHARGLPKGSRKGSHRVPVSDHDRLKGYSELR